LPPINITKALGHLAVRRGLAAAHVANRLLLLPLGPDKVHSAPLRRTPTHCKPPKGTSLL